MAHCRIIKLVPDAYSQAEEARAIYQAHSFQFIRRELDDVLDIPTKLSEVI